MKTIFLAILCSFGLLAATGPDTAVAKEVTAAMESFKQAILQKDAAALNKLLADDLTYTHSGGPEETKAEFVASVISGKAKIERLDFLDSAIRVNGNTALVKGRVDLYHSPTNIVHMNILHVWVKAPGGWKLLARQATRLLPAGK